MSKFADVLTLYRQEKIFARMGIELSRATMANWGIQAAQLCSPILDLRPVDLKNDPLINMDETPLQMLQEAGRANTAKSYMWVFFGGTPDYPTMLYRHHPGRSGEVTLKCLEDYMGFVQSYDYNGYDYLAPKKAIVHVDCWAHAGAIFSMWSKSGKSIAVIKIIRKDWLIKPWSSSEIYTLSKNRFVRSS